MKSTHSLVDRIRRDEPLSRPLDLSLRALTHVYRLGMLSRSLVHPTKVPARVISFGNVTAGGTGKTPAVIERAQAELAAGNTVAVLTRGYGANSGLKSQVIAHGSEAKNMAHEIGDEPALIARRVPNVLIARGSDRLATAQEAIARGCNVLILDDGFQYLPLERDENVVVIDATNPFGNGWLIPRGILREPISAIARATHVILTHCDNATPEALQTLMKTVRKHCPNAPVRMTRHEPDALWSVETGEKLPLSTLNGASVTAVCAIAQPEYFLSTLKSLGARIEHRHFFPDHADIPISAFNASSRVVITEKDAARLANPIPNVYALGIRLASFTPVNQGTTHAP